MAFLIKIFIFLGILVNFFHSSQGGILFLMRISRRWSLLLCKVLIFWNFLRIFQHLRVIESGVPLVCANCRCLLKSIQILMHAGVVTGITRRGNMHQPNIWNWTTTVSGIGHRNIKLQPWTWCVALKLIRFTLNLLFHQSMIWATLQLRKDSFLTLLLMESKIGITDGGVD